MGCLHRKRYFNTAYGFLTSVCIVETCGLPADPIRKTNDNAKKIYCLSPAYDITPGRTFFGEHMTAVNGKGKDIGDDDMIKVAANNKIDVSTAESILENCRRVIGRRALFDDF